MIALEQVDSSLKEIQVLILAPTREIAIQIHQVISMISKDIKSEVFIGGLPVVEDQKKLENCQIAIGTPGRIHQLITENYMKVNSVKLLILDEADKLMEDTFANQWQ